MGGTMRLGADPVKLHEGTRAREIYGEAGHLRAPPPPLRGQQPPAQAARARRPGLLAAPRPTTASSRSSSCPTTRSSWPRSTTPSSSRARCARSRCSASSWARRSSAPASARPRASPTCGPSARRACRSRRGPQRSTTDERERLRRRLRPPLRDREPVAQRARDGRRRDRRAARAGARGRGGRQRRRDRLRRRQPARPHRRARRARRTILLCAHLDTVPLDGAGRGRARGRRAPQPQRGASSAPTTRPPWRRSSAAARRLVPRGLARRRRAPVHHLRGAARCAGAKAFDRRPAARPSSASSSTTPRRSASSSWPRRPTTARGRLPRPRRPRRASAPRTAATRSRPRPRRDRGDADRAGSTRRRPPTSGRIEGGTAVNVVAERCTVELEARSLDDDARRRGRAARWSTPLTEAASDAECDVETDGRAAVPRLPAGAHRAAGRGRGGGARRHAASSRAYISTGGGSDANVFVAAGLPVRERGQRHRAQPPARRERDRGGARDRCST